MSLATVAVELDLYDGTGTLLTTGSAVFTPTGPVVVNNGLQEITAAPVTAALAAGSVQSASIIPTDTPGSSPAGWGWQVAFPGVPGGLGAFTFLCPAGPVAFTAATGTPGVFTWTPTSSFAALPNGSGIQFSGGSLPAGVAAATTYYVTGAAGTTFRVAATLGGSPLALTGSGSGNLAVISCLVSALAPAGSTVALSPYMFAPAGTPTAGQVPVATGTGSASAWGTPAGGAPLASPAFTGSPTAPTRLPLTASTGIATTAYTDSAVGVEAARATTAEGLKAPLASPAFTGTPVAPTPSPGDNTTKLATTAFVTAAGGGGVTSTFGRGGAITAQTGDYTVSQVTGAAPLASPTFTGTVTVPSTVGATDAAQKQYVDSVAAGLDSKPSATALAAASITLSGAQTIDGVAVTAGNRVLATAQGTASQNGLWTVASGAWTRPSDFASASSQRGSYVLVVAGTTYVGSGWVLSGTGAVTVDTSAQAWAQFSGAGGGSVSAGTGLAKTGSVVSLAADGTAGNIKALGASASAGTTGVAPSSDHVHPATGVVTAAGGGKETVSTVSSASGAVTLNLASGNVFNLTLTGNVTLTFSGATSGVACSFTAYITQDGTGGRTVTWPTVTWLTGTAPVVTATAGAVSTYVFESLNGGTTWFGSSVTGPTLPLPIAQGGTGATTALAALAALGGGSAKPWQFRPETYGAACNGKFLYDGAMTASSNVLHSASAGFTSGDVGKYVLVWGALTASSQPAYLFGTIITFTNSTTVVLSITATNTVTAVGVLYGTDDTAAIQAAVSAAVTYSLTGNGALGQVVLSEGIYCSGSAATLGDGTTTFGNASITLPSVAATSGVKAQVQITGAGSSQLPHWLQPVPCQAGSIIAAMRTDGSLNTTFGPTSIIGGPVDGYGGGGGTFSNMHVLLKGFTVLVPVSVNAYAGPDLYGVGQATVDDVSYLPLAIIPNTSATPAWPQLTAGTGTQYGTATYYPAYTFGLRMPANGNNAVSDIGSFTSYFTQVGLIGSEHCTFVSLKTLFSQYGILAQTTSGGVVTHGIAGLYWCCEDVSYPVGSVGSGYYQLDTAISIVVTRLDLEGQTQTVNDAASKLNGDIGFSVNTAATGYLTAQYASGGATLRLRHLDAASGPVASPQAPPASTASWPNYYYRDAWITLSATTITALGIDSTAQAVPSGSARYAFFLPSGHSYTPTYTGTLTHTVSLV
jgi:hypothetical protein